VLKKHDENSSLYSSIYLNDSKKLYWTKEIHYSQRGKVELPEDQQTKKNKYKKVEVSGRIICTYNHYRAQKDIKDREKILEKMKENFDNKTSKTKKFISNGGYKKYLLEKTKGTVELNEEKIKEEEKWDGLHGIFTNTSFSAPEIIKRYKDLVLIENSFRLSKTFLRMRPIYHYNSARIRGHVALCYLALCLTKYAEKILKKSNINISPEVLREELNSIQASFILDKSTNNIYKMPSRLSQLSKDIYASLGLNRDSTTTVVK